MFSIHKGQDNIMHKTTVDAMTLLYCKYNSFKLIEDFYLTSLYMYFRLILTITVLSVFLFSSIANAKGMKGWRYEGSEAFHEPLLNISSGGFTSTGTMGIRFTIKWKIGSMLQEPVEISTVKWAPTDINLWVLDKKETPRLSDLPQKVYNSLGITRMKVRFRVVQEGQKTIHTTSSTGLYISLDPGALSKPGDTFSFNVPGSPDWSKLFFISDASHLGAKYYKKRGLGGFGSYKRNYISAENAKKIYKAGFKLISPKIEDIDFNVNGVRAWLTKQQRQKKAASINLKKLKQQKLAALAKINAKARKSKKKHNKKSEAERMDDIFASFGDDLDQDERELVDFESERKQVRYRYSMQYINDVILAPYDKELRKIRYGKKKKQQVVKKHLVMVNERRLPQKLTAVRQGYGEWGYKNDSGEWIIDPEFESASPFKDNKAVVSLDTNIIKDKPKPGKCGFATYTIKWATINIKGEFIKGPEIKRYSDSLICIPD